MTSGDARRRRWFSPERFAFGVMLGAALVTACRKDVVPAPGFGAIDSADWNAVMTYAHSIRFDTSAAVSGKASFDTPTGKSTVVLSPAIGSNYIPDDSLRFGRIIGRAITTGAPAYFGSPVGTSYIWVDSTANGWRWLWLADSTARHVVDRSMFLGTTKFVAKERPRMLVVRDSFLNGRCGNRCCIPLAALTTPMMALVDSLITAAHATK